MKNPFPWGGNRVISFLSFSIILSFGVLNSLFAQEDISCATPDPIGPAPSGYYSHSQSLDYLDNDPVVFNIYFWGVRRPDGTTPNPLTETKALQAVQILNIEYNKYNIFFKYWGHESFNSRPNQPLYDDDCNEVVNGGGNPIIDPDGYGNMDVCEIGNFGLDVDEDGHYRTDAINVYVPFTTNGFGGIGVDPHFMMMATGSLSNPPLMIHEMGHVLGLFHTHSAFDNPHNPNGNPAYDAEHVERNPSNSNYNADEYGDYITDTAAVPPFSTEYCYFHGLPDDDCGSGSEYRYYYIDAETCSYDSESGNGDHLGELYQILPEDVQNYMGYTPSECASYFTPEQINVMWEEIEDYQTSIYHQDRFNDIASLYEPYKGTYGVGGAPSGPPPVFQPGFDYEFKSCGPYGEYPPPPDYDDTTFFVVINQGAPSYSFSKDIDPQDYNLIIHNNHYAITIAQLADYDDRDARCCYSVFAPGADDGNIIKFNDGVFNANVTITPQDSTQINNPLLIDNLEPGLYNIQKNYGGTTDENVILKENN